MKRGLAMAAACAALGGCVSFGAKPPPSLLTISSARTLAPDTERRAGNGEAIAVLTPLVPQAIANTRVAVADGDTAIAYVKDAQWVEPPARLFQRLLAETVAVETGRVVIDPRQFAFAGAAQLSGTLLRFGVDARSREAVIVYDAALSNDRGRNVRTKRFEARVPIAEVAPDEAGRALNRAANQVAGAVASWLKS